MLHKYIKPPTSIFSAYKWYFFNYRPLGNPQMVNFAFLHQSEPLNYPTGLYVSHWVRIIEVLLYFKIIREGDILPTERIQAGKQT